MKIRKTNKKKENLGNSCMFLPHELVFLIKTKYGYNQTRLDKTYLSLADVLSHLQ